MTEYNFCSFCESLNVYRFLSERFDVPGKETRQTVALVDGVYRKGRKTIESRTVNYREKGRGFPLNFCPECGRRLNGKND